MRQRREFTNEFKLEAVKLAETGDVPLLGSDGTPGKADRSPGQG